MISDICGVSLTRETAEGRDSVNLDNCEPYTPHTIRSAQRYFACSRRYGKKLNEIVHCYSAGLSSLASIHLSQLPTEKELLAELCEMLKEKPVGKSLRKLLLGETSSLATQLKTWSSVLTHVAIEIEHGNTEFKMLLPRLYEKLGGLIGGM